MPLRKLQEIIIDYAQHLYQESRHRALQFSIDYPYRGPVFAFHLNGDRMELTDNTQEPIQSQDGREIMERVDIGRFRKPKRNQVKAAFLKFRYWETKILTNGDRADLDNLNLKLETIASKLLPFAVAMLRSTAESYALLEPSLDTRPASWSHPVCDLTCPRGLLESGESVPAEIGEGRGIQRSFLRTAKAELARTGNQVAGGFVQFLGGFQENSAASARNHSGLCRRNGPRRTTKRS